MRGGGKQHVPPAGPKRDALRNKGQFWTPDWVAEIMVGYLIAGGSQELFDPAVGTGAFFKAARKLMSETNTTLALFGTEIDPLVLEMGLADGLHQSDLANVEIRDFVLHPPYRMFDGIVANPPYIRHHRLTKETKSKLKNWSKEVIGKPLDGRAGLHVYFLIRALQHLKENGRLAFIVPADVCEGVFAHDLWQWITQRYCLEAVITFVPEATPFPDVDTNPVILMIKASSPKNSFWWVECQNHDAEALKRWVLSGFSERCDTHFIHKRDLSEALQIGLSRPPQKDISFNLMLLKFGQVKRGIATGANDFFFLTHAQASFWGLPSEFLIPAIGRTRDVPGNVITRDTLERLNRAGRPTLLFAPDGRPIEKFPKKMQAYLRRGEELGISQRSLISTRHPWYKMERRTPPPILFAYLGRRNVRFIRNLAGVLPLTGFLCVYPYQEDANFIDKLYKVLQHPKTIANLAIVGKSYGNGAIKVEPRALERLPLPQDVVEQVGLTLQTEQYRQISFL
ncbi:MAG: SAM-dependent methyltransferase [Caldilineae bacterium]|nr:MAG: SAM-dependent methyltransferase [Caldilineae bacterium]